LKTLKILYGMRNSVKTLLLFVLFLSFTGLYAQVNKGYQMPPKEIVDLVDAPSTPSVVVNPGGTIMLLLEGRELPSIEDVASEELRIAGMRIDPATNGPSRSGYSTGIKILEINGSKERIIAGLPSNPKIRNLRWSPDGSKVAFTNTVAKGIELWYADINSAQAFKLTEPVLNDVMGNSFAWMTDNKTIFFTAIPDTRGELPKKPTVPEGPILQENLGTRAAVRTFQDLLSNKYDEDLFDYYSTVQLASVTLSGEISKTGRAGIISSFSTSPDGNYIMVNMIKKPYSYIVPAGRFPFTAEIWNLKGEMVYLLADIPLSENIPTGSGAVREGRRNFSWRADEPATIYWVEALDNGDPTNEVEFRDQVYYMKAPFSGRAVSSVKTNLRFAGITWGRKDLAVVTEMWMKDRKAIQSFFDPEKPGTTKRVVFERSTEDRYNHPGSFETTMNHFGRSVLLFDSKGRTLYLSGIGASPEGNRPFIDEFDIRTLKTKRLWRSEAPYFENPSTILDINKGLVLTRRESVNDQPNYFIRNLKTGKLTQVTDFPDPVSQLRDVKREMINYTRMDGVPLSGELYLPAGYKIEDGPLPAILWAYPREFKSADAAGQVSGSPYTYTRLGASSIVIMVTQGYAVLNNASFPIVGEGEQEPNDTFIEQLVANAEAAIDKLVEMGVADRKRIAVSGHSYGAFMTANLLSHSDIFAAGVARSGAYNRTLTPFGFQAEDRTYWEAPEVYFKMSPFSYADKMKTPMLLIHGEADNNSGTFPIQSERYYNALKGHGAVTRLVMLPHESHGYAARESILHMFWEYVNWLDTYVKNRK
jgi:dipeptidyl aminopeptidase/acylaminoacyl peptidase